MGWKCHLERFQRLRGLEDWRYQIVLLALPFISKTTSWRFQLQTPEWNDVWNRTAWYACELSNTDKQDWAGSLKSLWWASVCYQLQLPYCECDWVNACWKCVFDILPDLCLVALWGSSSPSRSVLSFLVALETCYLHFFLYISSPGVPWLSSPICAHCWATFSAFRALLSGHIMMNKDDRPNDDDVHVVSIASTNIYLSTCI